MQILYIWIEDYKSIKNQGFNLGGPYIFDYDQKQNVLAVKDNPHYIKDFFTPDTPTGTTITNVTAVIGSNGAGKTTFLDFIRENIYESYFVGYNKCIIVTLDNNNKIVTHYTEGISKPEVKIGTVNKMPSKSGSQPDWQCMSQSRSVSEIGVIFFSNIYTSNYIYRSFSGADISTQSLLKSELEVKGIALNHSVLENSIESMDPLRQLRFVGEYTDCSKILPFNLPKQIRILPKMHHTYLKDKFSNYSQLFHNGKKSGLFTFLEWYCIFCDQQFINSNKKTVVSEEWKCCLKCSAILIFLLEVCEREDSNRRPKLSGQETYKDFDNYNWNIQTNTLNCDINSSVEILLNILPDDHKTEKHVFKNIKTSFKKIIECIDCLSFEEDFWTKDIKKVIRLVTEIGGILSYDPLFAYEWPLSSGESAIFSIFARFWSLTGRAMNGVSLISKNKKSAIKYIENILVLIDEGDLYLHPQWQKQFLNSLMKFLCNICEGNKIQIILTSNAPIVASDLPSSNIIFLKQNNENGNSEVVKIEREQTFAANISSLLKDSFFIEGGMIGEFAAGKINEVITLLNAGNKAELLAQKEKVKKIIGLIGEPVIRHKLQSMLDDCLKLHLLDVDEEIESLKARLNKLEQQKQEKQK